MLQTRMSDLMWDICSVHGSLITSRTALNENIIVDHSMLLVVIRYDFLDLRCFKFLRKTKLGNCM